jgi:hypothetical protein
MGDARRLFSLVDAQYTRYRMGLRLGLANGTTAQDLEQVISVTPAPDGGVNVTVPEASFVLLEGSYPPGTELTVCMAAACVPSGTALSGPLASPPPPLHLD